MKIIFMLRKVSLLFIILLSLFSCSSNNSVDNNPGNGNQTITPSNLIVTTDIVGASVQNPNGDGSGKVNFTVSATNATAYTINFGNGESKYQTTGDFTVTYSTSGTNTYSVEVFAHNFGQNIKSTISISVFKSGVASLLWSDDFNVDGAPNSANWGYDLGNNNGWGNNELEYYTNRPENVIVQGGILKIITIKEPYNGFSYTSTRMLTNNKFSFRYGKVEIRAKLPAGAGTWPALWMLGDDINTVGWPACGEIDMMEHAANRLNKIQASLHHPGHSGGNPDGGFTNISNATSEFHIYTTDWRADSIKFYVDNQLYYTFTNTPSIPFNHNFFIILNNAMGGNFGGTVDPNFTTSIFEIDYVRVYN